MQDKIKQLLTALQKGDQRAVARAITVVENELPGYEELLQGLKTTGAPRVVGVTGPPGAGKSTLVNALLDHWIRAGKKIAVIAVDPSSPFNYGALLGDRIRMSGFYNHPDVFIRSLASRGALGGLHPRILEVTDVVKDAPFDIIVVETVGVGQSEVEIAGLADCTFVALVPEAGDSIQTMKAGVLEIADIFAVNKADREDADLLYRNLRILAHERAGMNAETPVVKTIATKSEGVAELAEAIEQHLLQSHTTPERRLHLLLEKSLHLIQSARMKDIGKMELREALANAVQKESFNLYSFVRSYHQTTASV